MDEAVGAGTAFRDAAEQIKWLETSAFPVQDRNKRAFTVLQPKGVFAVISPWNLPLSQPCCYYLAPALATGNAVVWVPAPTTSLIAAKILECMVEAGVPDGAVNLVTGEGQVVGDEIVVNSGNDAIASTGSSETGVTIARRGAGNPLLLECGGNGPTVVLEDADIPRVAERIARGCFTNAGQICTSTERILVAAPVYDAFVGAIAAAAGKVRLGDPFDAAMTMGPLNSEPTAPKVDAHLEDAVGKGAMIVTGAARQSNRPTSLYYQPTVIAEVAPDSLFTSTKRLGRSRRFCASRTGRMHFVSSP